MYVAHASSTSADDQEKPHALKKKYKYSLRRANLFRKHPQRGLYFDYLFILKEHDALNTKEEVPVFCVCCVFLRTFALKTKFRALIRGLLKLFSNKSAKEVKKLWPLVERINLQAEVLAERSAQELRAESARIRTEIRAAAQPISTQIDELKAKAPNLELEAREQLFRELDQLEKDKYKAIGQALDQALVPAFALMKETARRLSSQNELQVEATDWDRKTAARSNYVRLDGTSAYWSSTWNVADNPTRWSMIHYDVQLIGGIILHQGKIAEMATGEGKTLVATLPAFLNGLSGLGVHIVTVNDYLARRDAAWNAPLFEFHGLSVDCIDLHRPHSEARAESYQSDILYGTNNEFGFDYLRDNMAQDPEELVQRGHFFAMIDEVDSVLIDEARTPLIISGPVGRSNEDQFYELKPFIERLVHAQRSLCNTYLNEAKKLIQSGNKKEAGLALLRVHRSLPKYKPLIRYFSEEGVKQIMQRSESLYLQDNQRLMPEADAPLYFTIDEKNHSIELTEKGHELLATEGQEKDLFIMPDIARLLADLDQREDLSPTDRQQKKEAFIKEYSQKSERIHILQQLLRAYTLYEKDTDYVVMNGKVQIIDEQTGRILEGRRYSDGLHQALEAREQVKVEEATQTYATITLQNYFRMYHKLSGMTGTAETEAAELWNIYKLDVTVIPTHRPMVRKDRNDRVYRTTREKFNAIIEEIEALRKSDQPVLVGTTSVEASELLSRLLKLRRIPHQVLNAKQHQKEAEVVAQAGQAATVTIATNMAGRGTDIKLSQEAQSAGGLAIIGSERHESRRVDRQLRGRSGRQGDPGSSQFFVSMEDNLMRLFGSGRIAKWMDRLGLKEGEVIEHSMITSSIERAQKKVEENNFGIRKRLLEYDNVMNMQREVIYKKRRHALLGERLQTDLEQMRVDVADELAADAVSLTSFSELQMRLIDTFGSDFELQEADCDLKNQKDLAHRLSSSMYTYYETRKQYIRDSTLPVLRYTYEQHKGQIEEVAIPIRGPQRGIQLVVDLEECLESEAESLIKEMEKLISLSSIDIAWKEHLREMDDLKQSVQNVVYEQKDPLLVYKFEAFELFRGLISRLHLDTLCFLMKADVPQPDQSVEQTTKRRTKQHPRLQEQKEEATSSLGTNRVNPSPASQSGTPTQPVRSEKQAGRNDKVTVQYTDGRIEKEIKYKKVAQDIKEHRCVILEVHR